MPIPDYQKFMLPLLRALTDGGEHRNPEFYEKLSEYFHLSPEDINLLLPSGKQPLYINRITWAKTYLKKAGLIESVKRGICRATPQGIEVAKKRI